eukprot:scaffold5421_cov350-Prasinococcus_capsulatus_cf.AAC.3
MTEEECVRDRTLAAYTAPPLATLVCVSNVPATQPYSAAAVHALAHRRLTSLCLSGCEQATGAAVTC